MNSKVDDFEKRTYVMKKSCLLLIVLAISINMIGTTSVFATPTISIWSESQGVHFAGEPWEVRACTVGTPTNNTAVRFYYNNVTPRMYLNYSHHDSTYNTDWWKNSWPSPVWVKGVQNGSTWSFPKMRVNAWDYSTSTLGYSEQPAYVTLEDRNFYSKMAQTGHFILALIRKVKGMDIIMQKKGIITLFLLLFISCIIFVIYYIGGTSHKEVTFDNFQIFWTNERIDEGALNKVEIKKTPWLTKNDSDVYEIQEGKLLINKDKLKNKLGEFYGIKGFVLVLNGKRVTYGEVWGDLLGFSYIPVKPKSAPVININEESQTKVLIFDISENKK